MQAVTCQTVNEAFEWLCARAIKSGRLLAPRNQTTLELEGPTVVKILGVRNNLVTNSFRKPNYAFALAEVLQIWSGDDRVDRVGFFNKQILKYSDDGVKFSGAYGPPFRGQLDYVVETLRRDRDSRQAVLTIWKPNPVQSRDIPCTVMLHFMIRDMRLDLIVYMRSNDIWLGFTYDAYVFTTLQAAVASILGVKPGVYTHIAGSMHLYHPDFSKASWVRRYSGSVVAFELPDHHCGDLDRLVAIERDLREKGLDPLDHGNWPAETSDYVKLNADLLRAYHKKCEYPEPYRSLRLAGRKARNEVGGSNPDSTD